MVGHATTLTAGAFWVLLLRPSCLRCMMIPSILTQTCGPRQCSVLTLLLHPPLRGRCRAVAAERSEAAAQGEAAAAQAREAAQPQLLQRTAAAEAQCAAAAAEGEAAVDTIQREHDATLAALHEQVRRRSARFGFC